jgi:hypothetical protein
MPLSRTAPARSLNSLASASGRPNSFTSRAPDTLNRSVMVVLMLALSCMLLREMRLIRPDSRRSRTRKGGSTKSDRAVICQDRTNMGTSVATRVNTSEVTDAKVDTEVWASSTSLVSRLISDPVWVRLKKATGIRCTWSYSWVRRS